MATLKNIYSGYAFSGNPILLDIPKGNGSPVDYSIDVAGRRIFEGRVTPPITLNLASTVDPALDFFPDVPEGNVSPVVNLLDDTGDMTGYYTQIALHQGTYQESRALIVFPGGVSLQNFRKYASEQTDVFQARLLNHGGNFFLTGFSDDWLIVMRETELSPLYFLSEGEVLVEIRELLGDNTVEYDADPGVNALDIRALRRMFFDNYRILPSQFDVSVNGRYSCRIVIRESELRAADYRLIYRNAFGVKERLEIDPGLELYPEAGEKETSTRYDPVTESLTGISKRTPVAVKASARTPTLYAGETARLLDLLASEEVWLEGLSPEPLKVIATADEISFKARQTEPCIFTINLEFAENTGFPMPDIRTSDASVKPLSFGESFGNSFS